MSSQPKLMTDSSTPADTPPESLLLEASHQVAGHYHALKLIDPLKDAAGPTATNKWVLPIEDIQQLMGLLAEAKTKRR
jgi:hypothetical protein